MKSLFPLLLSLLWSVTINCYITKNGRSFSVASKFLSPSRRVYNMGPGSLSLTSMSAISAEPPKKASNKLFLRWVTGLSLGAIATAAIFAGKEIFGFMFLIGSLVAQKEYYDMVRATGVEPAIKTGFLSSTFCFLTAMFYPKYHEIVMPLSTSFLMLWLLVFNKRSAKISEISTSLLGMFYLGYLPSFWVRLRAISRVSSTFFPKVFASYPMLRAEGWTVGAITVWWTLTSIVAADVGAYFIGKRLGKNKLGLVSSAAGSASPKKTIEGALGGFISCTMFSLMGAYLMQWPMWPILGPIYGLVISFIALVGDLTASMMKRDAGWKDTGSILPGHGGVLDRLDSYIFTAPIAYFFVFRVLPFFDLVVSRRLAVEHLLPTAMALL